MEARASRRRSYLMLDKTGSLSNPLHNFTTVHYDAESEIPRIPADLLRAAPAVYDQPFRELYLQLPKLDPRIPALAKQIVGRSNNPYEQAHAIEMYLRSHYGYTLDLSGPPQTDPLAYFLFQKRAGHCEYFAAAMTVMLRSLGVPARYVNGFLPGEYNSVGGDFIVRARDAHSWVEVFFPGYGWITFDPTPAGPEPQGNLFARLSLYWDYFDLQWKEWVINYDFIHQYTLAQNLQRSSRSWSTEVSSEFGFARNAAVARMRSWQTWLAGLPVWLLIPLGLAALGVSLRSDSLREWLLLNWNLGWLFRELGKPSLPTLPPQAAVLSYRRMLRLLERRGWRKLPAQTPLEFCTPPCPRNRSARPSSISPASISPRASAATAPTPRASPALLGDLQARPAHQLRLALDAAFQPS